MKRIICLLLASGLMLGMSMPGWAQTYELEAGTNGYFVCEDFDSEMPQMAKGIFGSLIWEHDEVLCGTLFQEHYRNSPGKVNRGGALMAVKRDGKILLMSAKGDEGQWNAGIETDSFLPPDAEFSITTTGRESVYVHLTILYRDTAYEIRTTSTGGAYLYEYSWTDETGKALRMDCHDGEFRLCEEGDWPYAILEEGKAVPSRLSAWTADALPKTAEDIRAFEEKYPLQIEGDEAFITGVNLRERATGESASWGKYFAKVQVLGEQPGKQNPWVHVRMGDLEGWVSGNYVHGQGKGDQMHVYDAAVMVHPVGRAKTETELLQMPSSDAVMQLEAGTYVHVLGERDGHLHVIVPRGELNWQTDWKGTYGFVRAADMAVGLSKADAAYRN